MLVQVGDTIEYDGAAYVGGKPLAGRRGVVTGRYTSPTGRHMIEVQFGKGDFALTDPGPYHVVKHASRDRSKRSSRDRDQSHGWEVWSLGDPSFDDEPVYVATYKDKGEARTKIARLRRSHPHVRYEIRRRRAAANRFFGSRGRRRGYRKVPRY